MQKSYFRNILIRLTLLICVVLLANLPTNVFASQLNQEYPIYIVQEGDSLYLIARRFNVSIEELQGLNGITDINDLDIGQRLKIPGLEGVSGLLITETLPFGVSLNGLSRRYQTSEENLSRLNHLTSPSETIAGIDFLVPTQEGAEALLPIYLLSKGQTALDVAIKSANSTWALVNANGTSGTWDIIPGELLFGKAQDSEEDTSIETVSEIIFNNLPIIQGETLEIHVTAPPGLDITGRFDGKPIQFLTENDRDYYSFTGIHALTNPGIYAIRIEVNEGGSLISTIEQHVLLTFGGYGNEWVDVPNEYLDQAKIAEEDAYLEPILRQITPERYWDGQFIYPVDEPCVGSIFGLRRDYNGGNYFFYHTGMDFPVCTAQNLNIYATAAGKVVVAEELYVKGKVIFIDHGWGVFSAYAHLSEFAVEVGDFVQPGDLLGIMGNTGRSAGTHLHFEIDITGTPVNPQTWLNKEFP